jgi:hypothetical protein
MLRPPNHVSAITLQIHSGRDTTVRALHSRQVSVDQVLAKMLSLVRSGLWQSVAVFKEPLVTAVARINIDHIDAVDNARGHSNQWAAKV